jgi:hypothetical protein
MSKFPVEISDKEGIVDAVNYVLSGPAGLGQNFAGFSSFDPAWLTGNFRVPYSLAFFSDTAKTKTNTPARLYVPPIDLQTSEMLDGRTYKFTFKTVQKTAPFALGNGITVAGVDNDWYNDTYATIGVTQCTTAYVIVRTSNTYPVKNSGTGGTISLTTGTGFNSTDCNARVTVSGGTDKVFISAQLDSIVSYTASAFPALLNYTVAVNRYRGEPNNNPVNPDYIFNFDETVAAKTYVRDGLGSSGTLPLIETVFTSILDRPKPGFYWYILEVKFQFNTHTVGTGKVSNGQATTDLLALRSLSAQVVKP